MIQIFESNDRQELVDGINKYCSENKLMITSQSMAVYTKKNEKDEEEMWYSLSADVQKIPMMMGSPSGIIGVPAGVRIGK